MKHVARLAATLSLLAAALGAAPRTASAQGAASGTQYVVFWRGDLRVIATRPDTEIELIDLATGGRLGAGYTANIPGNPVRLDNVGDSYEARTTGTATLRVRIIASTARGPREDKPVVVFTGSLENGAKHPLAPPVLSNAWLSNLPVIAPGSVENGAEIGRDLWGFATEEMWIYARKGAVPTSITIDDVATNVETDIDDTRTLNRTSPELVAQDGAMEVYHVRGFEDDTVHVTANTDICVSVGAGSEAGYDWTITPPSFAAGEDSRELGTLFYAFVGRDLTIFPTQDNTNVTITDLSDGDDSIAVTLNNGDLVGDYDLFTSDLYARNGTGITPRPAGPAVRITTLDPAVAPFDNDVVRVEADRPVLLYVGPKASDTSEYADVAYPVRTGPASYLTYAYAQNGGADDMQVFAFDPATNVRITSLTYTTGFRNNGAHDFSIPSPTPWLGGNPTTGDYYWSSAIWNGEMLRITSDGPLTIIDGDYDGPNFGCFIPFVSSSGLLLPIADAGPDLGLCPGQLSVTLDGTRSFDADTTPGTFVPSWTWDLDATVDSDGDTVPTNDVDLTGATATFTLPSLGTYAVTLTYRDDDGQVDTDLVVVSPSDVQSPTLSCPTLVSVPADPSGTTFVSVLATASDDCDVPAIENDRTELGADASDNYPCGDTRVLFTATDATGNSSTCLTVVRVVDTTPPSVGCPGQVTVPADPSGTTFVTVVASPADDCGFVTVVNDRTAGGADASGVYPCGDTRVLFTATDAQGNVSACATTVTVVGSGAPSLSCPGVVTAPSSGSATTFVDVRAIVTGDCGAMTVTNDRTAGGVDASDFYPCGDTSVKWNGVDDLGNPYECSTTVSVLDAAGPMLSCPPLLQVPPDTPTGATVAFGATGQDDCDPTFTITNDRTSGGADATDFYPCGPTLVTFTGTDSVPNTSACVTRVEVTPPLSPGGVGAALRGRKDPVDPRNVVHFRWDLAPPRQPWEHYLVFRTSQRGRPIPLFPTPELTAQQFTDTAAGGDLLFYEILATDCSGATAP